MDFTTNATSITREKNHYIILKGMIPQENISLVNIYAPNRGAPKYIKIS